MPRAVSKASWFTASALPPLSTQASADAVNQEAFETARGIFEDHDPRFGRRAEREDNDYLARAFADFDALWHGGEYARWAEQLVKPLSEAVGKPPKEQVE